MKALIRTFLIIYFLSLFCTGVTSNAHTYDYSNNQSLDSLLVGTDSMKSALLRHWSQIGEEEKIAILTSMQQSIDDVPAIKSKPNKQENNNILWIIFYIFSMLSLIVLLKQYYQKRTITSLSNFPKKHGIPPSSVGPTNIQPSTAESFAPIQLLSDKKVESIDQNSLKDQIKLLTEKNQTSQRRLTANSLEFIRHENLVKTIGQKLSPVINRVKGDTRNQLIELSNLVERHQNHKDEWESFNHFFGQVHPGFTIQLQEQFPELSNNDIRLISFLRLQLTTGEIASLLKVTPSSIHKARYRLKKKLQLDKEIDLDKFLANIAAN